MDSNADSQQSHAPNHTEGEGPAQQRGREVQMVLRHFKPGKIDFTAVYDPECRCCIMPKAFLEHHKCLDEMESEPATHNSSSRPHDRLGTFDCVIRLAGRPCKTYSAKFCIIDGAEGDLSPIYVGRETTPPLSLSDLSTSKRSQGGQKPIRPLLPGRKHQGLLWDLTSSKSSQLTGSRGPKS